MSPPLGLHLQLMSYGASLRFAVWFERPGPVPDVPARRATYGAPQPHPAHLSHGERPSCLPGSLGRQQVTVRLPRHDHTRPVPLPALAEAARLGPSRRPASGVHTGRYVVHAWIIPPALTLGPLRQLLLDWSQHHGPGALSPHAPAVVALLDELLASVAAGPLLPTLTPTPAAVRLRADAMPDPESTVALGWVPPVSLPALNRLHRALRGLAFLPAVAISDRDDTPGWRTETRPARLALFLLECLSGAVAHAPEVPADEATVRALRIAVARGDAAPLHRAHGACLFPQHPVLAPVVPAPRDHLHARVHPMEGPDAAGDPWAAEFGVLHGDGRSFLPLAALIAGGTLRDALVEHEGAMFLHPGAVLERDWSYLVRAGSRILLRPEALTGHVRLSEPQAQMLLSQPPVPLEPVEYQRWIGRVGLAPPKRRPKDLVAFTVAPGGASAARVRVRWDLAVDPADPARLGLHSSRFVPHLELSLGDDALPTEEAERLLGSSAEGFLRVAGHVVPRAELVAAVDLLRAREKVLRNMGADRGVNYAGAVALDDEWAAERAAQAESIFSARWESFLDGLRDGVGVPQLKAPAAFRGTLRPYQERGLSWLAFLAAQGFGGCLADDMGLGKTVQVLALLATRRAKGAPAPRGPDLVVCPTSVVINWAREAKKFTPTLKVYVHQGLQRERDAAFAKAAAGADVVVTSYAIARRDEASLTAVRWGAVIVDEAQNLKNPTALQTRALRSLDAESKFGLTGTPVENHLRDIWSIFDVMVPGLLGGATRFARTFETPARNGDPEALARLSRRVGPFLLRRTKRDPAVAADLPPLQLQDLGCELTREQTALYQAMTEATLEGIADKDGIQRRAHILAALTRFKQICNHPESFEPERPDELFGRSGKLDRVLEVLEELLAEDQRVLIFTQFVEMGRILQRALAARFKVAAGFFHGGLTPAQREAMVDAFQGGAGPPVLILSLKAGGTGLNLTAASAVIHYDRWWNPAVEDQATDRAHRIGQTRRVNVYRLVTEGTLEERVAELLETKRAMADKILGGADESWITELDDRALRAFLSLGNGAKGDG